MAPEGAVHANFTSFPSSTVISFGVIVNSKESEMYKWNVHAILSEINGYRF